jgi:hypothetical protein
MGKLNLIFIQESLLSSSSSPQSFISLHDSKAIHSVPHCPKRQTSKAESPSGSELSTESWLSSPEQTPFAASAPQVHKALFSESHSVHGLASAQ